RLSFYVSHDCFTGDLVFAAFLFHEYQRNVLIECVGEQFAKALCPLYSSRIRRHDGRLQTSQATAEVGNKEGSGFKVYGGFSECILKGRQIVDIHRSNRIYARRLEELSNVTSRYRISQFSAAVLARVPQIGADCRKPGSAHILEC